ncbi:hypothetical protein PFISCL1PPCAC_3715 [Pristionchus fissidentatus]|uniref:Uncharacterized protein n=1 Tax=Pristionchus fissidentatus TaxID=1538716 RepID=A0AAV5V1X5_9BILA|nr:hypothetical protein PFISCL1PPCAC_3715 [Pristionchus fissidentatus]
MVTLRLVLLLLLLTIAQIDCKPPASTIKRQRQKGISGVRRSGASSHFQSHGGGVASGHHELNLTDALLDDDYNFDDDDLTEGDDVTDDGVTYEDDDDVTTDDDVRDDGLDAVVEGLEAAPPSTPTSPPTTQSTVAEEESTTEDETTTTEQSILETREDASPIPAEGLTDTFIIGEMMKGYDPRVRPASWDNTTQQQITGPVNVEVNMLIRSISKIDNVNMEYSVQLTFRESWYDPRLRYNYGVSTPDFVIMDQDTKVWMPDSFFQNEKQAHRHIIDKPNVLIRVYRYGMILYSVRLSLVLSCPMRLQNYPMDIQTCLIDVASYAYTDKDINYSWKEISPVQQKDGLNTSLPSFKLEAVKTDYCTSNTNTGTYSCLRTQLVLKRQFSYYLLQLYIPSSMLVIVSWVSFWLDRSAVPARVTLGVTTLLTMTTQASGINAKLPPVAYIKAIDVWIGACLTFIFGALLEFALVTFLAGRNEQKKKKTTDNGLLEANECGVWIPKNALERAERAEKQRLEAIAARPGPLTRWWRRNSAARDTSLQCDFFSRIMFPLLFIFFNILYWTHYQYPDLDKHANATAKP